MKKVILEGFLGERYGREWDIVATTYGEVFGCIQANYPTFQQDLVGYYEAGGDLSIATGLEIKQELEIEDLVVPVEDGTLIITPIPSGSKSGGAKILAAIAIAALVVITQGGFAAVGAAMAEGGLTGFAITTALSVSINLAITGIQQLLAPDPSVDNNDQNYLFQGPENVTATGNPVPILFGEMIIGGLTMTSAVVPGNGVGGMPGYYIPGHYAGYAPGYYGVNEIVGGSDGGLGGMTSGSYDDLFTSINTIPNMSSGLPSLDSDLILYSDNTISRPWAAKAPRQGIHYISPSYPQELPTELWEDHYNLIKSSPISDVNWDEIPDEIIGDIPTTGGLFRKLQDFTSSSSGLVTGTATTGQLSITLDNFTSNAQGSVAVVGHLNKTLDDFTTSSAGLVSVGAEIFGSLNKTLDDFTSVGVGTAPFIGQLSSTLDSFTSSSEGITSQYFGNSNITLDDFTSSSEGLFTSVSVGALAATIDSFTVSSAAEYSSGSSRGVPVFEGSTITTDTQTNSLPSGIQEGDLLIGCFFKYGSTTTSLTVPSGWTAVGSLIRRTTSDEFIASQIAYKIAGSSEGSTVTSNWTTGGFLPCSMIARYSNVDTSQPVSDNVEANGFNTTSTMATLSSPYGNGKLLFVTVGYIGVIQGPPSGMTTRAIHEPEFYARGIFDETIEEAGSTGTRSLTRNISSAWTSHGLIINGST